MPGIHSGTDGFIPFRVYKTWYRIVGDVEDVATGKHPILALHGSPISHQSLLPLAQLADTSRPVIFYDQLGCGFSDQPQDPTIWSMDLFVDQLASVRDALDLNHIHLFGHSFGGMIALDYMLTEPTGIASLTLHSTYDTVTPMMAKILHEGIDGSEWVFFEGSSHYAHAEETEHFLTAMDGFLTRVEQNQ